MTLQSLKAFDNAGEASTLAHSPSQPQEVSPMLLKDTISHAPMRQTRFLFLATWLFEIISFCLALAVLAVVVAILAVYNGRPNPLWTGGITLNTVISIASMLFRISLLVPVASCTSQLSWVWLAQGRRPLYDVVRFDNASRSPYGSLELLFSHDVQSFAFIGAIVSILSLVIGPFFQQSMAFYSASVVDATSTSYASYASDYNATVGFVSTSSPDMSLKTPFNMKSAIHNGFFSSAALSLPGPPFSCPSGNCTWDPFPTLAIGVQCRDTTELFRMGCSKSDDTDDYLDRCVIVGTDQPENKTHLRIAPKKDDATVIHFAEYYDGNTFGMDPLLWTIPMGAHADLDWIRATDLHVEWTDNYRTLSFIGRNSTIECRQCMFYTSLQEISARVENGVYSESVLREVINATVNKDETVRTVKTYTYTYLHNNGTTTNLTLSGDKQAVLLREISAPFMGFEKVEVEGDFVRYDNLSMGHNDELIGAEMMQILYLAPNLTDMVHTMARYMNVALRSVDTFIDLQADPKNITGLPTDYIAPKHQVPGLVHINKIHVKVRWGWLALPAILAVLVLTLLVATIAVSEREKVGIWKDNPLALLLFSRWDEQSKPAVGYARTQKDIRLAAEGMWAELAKDTDEGCADIKGTILIERKSHGG